MAVEVLRIDTREVGSHPRDFARTNVEMPSQNSERFAFMDQSTIESNWHPQSWLGKFWRRYVAVPFEMRVRQLLVADGRKEDSYGRASE